jgi:hypothetical protein
MTGRKKQGSADRAVYIDNMSCNVDWTDIRRICNLRANEENGGKKFLNVNHTSLQILGGA